MNDNKKLSEKGKKFKLRWGATDKLPAYYSNQLFITHGIGDEFYLILGNLTPPIALSESDFPDEIEIEPIVKIVLSPESMKAFVEVMSNNLKKYEEKQKEN